MNTTGGLMDPTKCRLFSSRPTEEERRVINCTCDGCKLYDDAMEIYKLTTLSWGECVYKAKGDTDVRI